jgi:hypothetical protein
MNAWNKTFSIFYASVADIRLINSKLKNKQKLNTILNTLAGKWDNELSKLKYKNLVTAPYIETISQYFPSNFMKRPFEQETVKKPTKKNSTVF